MPLNVVTEIDNRVAVKHVLMSVSDKSGLETFVPALVKACPGVKIYEASCITVGLFDTDSGVKRCEYGARSAECLQRAA